MIPKSARFFSPPSFFFHCSYDPSAQLKIAPLACKAKQQCQGGEMEVSEKTERREECVKKIINKDPEGKTVKETKKSA